MARVNMSQNAFTVKTLASSVWLEVLNQGVLNAFQRSNVPEGEVSIRAKKTTIEMHIKLC
jgi:hypothetical protein